MAERDDPIGDMEDDNLPDRDLSDAEIERLIAGDETPPGFESVADAFAALRNEDADAPIPVSASLGEFVSARPHAGPVGVTPAGEQSRAEEITLRPTSMSPTPRRRQRMLAGLAGTSLAKLAVTATVALAGITGAHAAGLVDVPLLPDEGEPVEVVLANEPASSEGTRQASDFDAAAERTGQQGPATSSQATTELQISVEEGRVTAELGDLSLSLSIQSSGGEFTIDIEVDGVSPECEAAIEGLEGLTSPDQVEAAGAEIEAVCRDELDQLLPDMEDLEFDVEGFFAEGHFEEFFGEEGFEGFFGEQIVPFLGEDFNPEDLQEFFDELEDGLPEFFGEGTIPFLEDFNPEDLQEFFDELEDGLPEFFGEGTIPFLEDFNPEDLQEFFDELEDGLPEFFGEGTIPFLEDFNPEDLQEFFDELEDGLPEFFGEGTIPFLEDFNPEDLQEFFDELEDGLPEFFGEGTIPFLEDFNPEDLQEFFDELEDGLPEFFDEVAPEDEDVAA